MTKSLAQKEEKTLCSKRLSDPKRLSARPVTTDQKRDSNVWTRPDCRAFIIVLTVWDTYWKEGQTASPSHHLRWCCLLVVIDVDKTGIASSPTLVFGHRFGHCGPIECKEVPWPASVSPFNLFLGKLWAPRLGVCVRQNLWTGQTRELRDGVAADCRRFAWGEGRRAPYLIQFVVLSKN